MSNIEKKSSMVGGLGWACCPVFPVHRELMHYIETSMIGQVKCLGEDHSCGIEPAVKLTRDLVDH